jgi:hypothetical protein
LLLVKLIQGKPQATSISEWWWAEDSAPFETYNSHYADANGDGIMEIFVNWSYYEGGGVKVYTLKDGKPVLTELGFFDGL